MTNKELLQDALNILEPIPQDKWVTGVFSDGNGNHCALGHYMSKRSWEQMEYLRLASEHALTVLHPGIPAFIDIATINNNDDVNGYTEPVIKDRVIHFLKDAVAIEEDF